MVSKDSYLKELLRRYEASFDITENFRFKSKTYPAYARFCSLSEKYVLKKEATLWSVKAFEHVFFLYEDEFTQDTLDHILSFIQTDAEPELVRQGGKYPEKDHMCTYLTFVVLASKAPEKSVLKAVRKFHYDRGYLFNFRGHSEARLAVVSMDSGNVNSNCSGRELTDLLKDVYKKASIADTDITKAATGKAYACVG